MTTKEEILSFAGSNPGFVLCDLLNHLKKQHKSKVDSFKVLRYLGELCDEGKLISEIVPNGNRQKQLWRLPA